MILIAAGVGIILLWAYILFIREWLAHDSPWAEKFQWIHALEDKLWQNSRTILVGRAYWLGGLIVGLQSLIAQSGVDTTSLLAEIGKLIPEQYRGLVLGLFMVITGLVITWLRRQTTTSLEEK